MELLQLKYFMDSAENENFSKTAKKYMVPPSSVSISIKKLERELGCELFLRKGNKINLNSSGKYFYNVVKKSIEELDDAVTMLKTSPEQIGEIKILVRSERRIIMQYIVEFKKIYPNIAFRIMHDFNTTDTDKYDIIIDSDSDSYFGFKRIPLIREKLRFAVSKNNPLCERKLKLSDLCGEPFISMGQGSSMNRLTKEYCKKAGFSPNIIIECDDPYYLRKYIELDFGVALIPETSWQGELSENVAFLDINDFDESRVTYFYQNKNSNNSTKQFYGFLNKKMAEF
jgi:DNA-binding transcriptional LysR family regulator